MHGVVEVGNGLPQGLDAGSGAVLATGDGDVDGLGALEAARDVVLDLRGTLAKVGPGLGLVEVAILDGTLGAPDDTGRGTRGVETGVGHVPRGISELAVRLGEGF